MPTSPCRCRTAGGGWRSSAGTPRPAWPRPRAGWRNWRRRPPGSRGPSWRRCVGQRGWWPSRARWRRPSPPARSGCSVAMSRSPSPPRDRPARRRETAGGSRLDARSHCRRPRERAVVTRMIGGGHPRRRGSLRTLRRAASPRRRVRPWRPLPGRAPGAAVDPRSMTSFETIPHRCPPDRRRTTPLIGPGSDRRPFGAWRDVSCPTSAVGVTASTCEGLSSGLTNEPSRCRQHSPTARLCTPPQWGTPAPRADAATARAAA